MTICAVKWCHNSSGKQKKCNNINFHRIPANPVIADKWVKKIRLSRREIYWKPNKYTRICSNHFNNEDKYITQGGLCKLRPNAVPVKGLHISCIGTDDEFEDNLNVDEVLPSHGLSVSSLNVAEDMKEDSRETSNRNLVMESSSQPSTSRGNIRRPSDDEFHYVFDTPREVLLRIKLNKSSLLNLKYRKIIRNLKQNLQRLQKRYKALKGILGKQQNKKFISNDGSNLLSENVEKINKV